MPAFVRISCFASRRTCSEKLLNLGGGGLPKLSAMGKQRGGCVLTPRGCVCASHVASRPRRRNTGDEAPRGLVSQLRVRRSCWVLEGGGCVCRLKMFGSIRFADNNVGCFLLEMSGTVCSRRMRKSCANVFCRVCVNASPGCRLPMVVVFSRSKARLTTSKSEKLLDVTSLVGFHALLSTL